MTRAGRAVRGEGLIRRLATLVRKVALTSPRGVRSLVRESFFEGLTPEFLWLEATDACGSRCSFCDIWKKKPSGNPLSPSEIERVLGDPLFARLKVVIVSGGEPTVRRDLEEILAAVHRARPQARMVLSSSAMLPEKLLRVVRTALEQGIQLEVGVSLDGLASRHDQARGIPGLFEKVDGTLRELAELRRLQPERLRVKVGFTLSDLTVDQLDAVRDYTVTLGLEFNVQWYNQGAYYGNERRDLLSDSVQLERVTRTLPPTALNALGRGVLQGKPLDYRCATLHNACLLKSNGDVVPCFKYWDHKAGNVRERSPSSLWKSEGARKTRAVVRDCRGCLNSCGVLWSLDANPFWRLGQALRRSGLRWAALGGLRRRDVGRPVVAPVPAKKQLDVHLPILGQERGG